jgi:RimJ/RimL family protein N-acetyltransferase
LGPWSRWHQEAPSNPNIVYFAIERDGRVIGEMFLHDIEPLARQAMVGYRIFDEVDRGQGTGSEALAILVEWVRAAGTLDRLVAITRGDNQRSRHLLERSGFVLRGPAREDTRRVVYELVVT